MPVPFIEAEDQIIKDSLKVAIGKIVPGSELYFITDGTIPGRNSNKYEEPIYINETKTLKAIAYKEDYGYSFPVTAEFV